MTYCDVLLDAICYMFDSQDSSNIYLWNATIWASAGGQMNVLETLHRRKLYRGSAYENNSRPSASKNTL